MRRNWLAGLVLCASGLPRGADAGPAQAKQQGQSPWIEQAGRSMRGSANRSSWAGMVTPSVALGVSAAGDDRSPGRAGFGLAFRPEFMIKRKAWPDWGVGLYAEVATVQAFEDLVVGGGSSVRLPTGAVHAFVFSGGGYGLLAQQRWDGGLGFGIYWGIHTLVGGWQMAPMLGLRVDARVGLGSRRHLAIVVGPQFDLVGLYLFSRWLFRG